MSELSSEQDPLYKIRKVLHRHLQAAALAKVQTSCPTPGRRARLGQLCERWIYSSCLCFALSLEEQKPTRFRYQYSIYQMEYSRNLIFRRGGQMEQIFQGLIDRTRARLNVKRLKTIFGRKRRPSSGSESQTSIRSRGRDTCV